MDKYCTSVTVQSIIVKTVSEDFHTVILAFINCKTFQATRKRGWITISKQLHQKPRSEASLSDEYETPDELYHSLCEKYHIEPHYDVACNVDNVKCFAGLTHSLDDNIHWTRDVWCNPPHSKNEEFVRKAYLEWIRNNINILMILPTNTMSSKYWHECIEGNAEYHPIKGRIRFLVDGKPSEHCSRNAYVCVIWRARK